jgi:uncharacterized membrane-anchored protein YjiN (DUF445 family)
MKYFTVIRDHLDRVQIGDRISNLIVAEVRRDNLNRETGTMHYSVMEHDDDKELHKIVER